MIRHSLKIRPVVAISYCVEMELVQGDLLLKSIVLLQEILMLLEWLVLIESSLLLRQHMSLEVKWHRCL